MQQRTEPIKDPGPQTLRPGCLSQKLRVASLVGLEASWECGLLVGHPLPQVVGQSENPPSFFTFPREFSKGPGVAPPQYLALLVTGGPADHSSARRTGRWTANHTA